MYVSRMVVMGDRKGLPLYVLAEEAEFASEIGPHHAIVSAQWLCLGLRLLLPFYLLELLRLCLLRVCHFCFHFYSPFYVCHGDTVSSFCEALLSSSHSYYTTSYIRCQVFF